MTPDFDQIARALIGVFAYEWTLPTEALTDGDAIEKVAHELRQVWNARGEADTQDAERYRWLRSTFEGAKAGGTLGVNEVRVYYEQPPAGEEVDLQWYPDTPVGFNRVTGRTLDEAIDRAMGKAPQEVASTDA